MTASLLKKLLQYEQRLETDRIHILTKDWDSVFQKGLYYEDELIITNSYKNA
jgi:hypothetical protein